MANNIKERERAELHRTILIMQRFMAENIIHLRKYPNS